MVWPFWEAFLYHITHICQLAKQKEEAPITTTAGWKKYRLPVVMVTVTSAGVVLIGVAAFHYWTGKPWSTLQHLIMHQ